MTRLRNTTEFFIKKAIKVHGNRYDYSKVVYKDCKTKIEIICKKHGSFMQRASSHLEGFNCRKCLGWTENEIKEILKEFKFKNISELYHIRPEIYSSIKSYFPHLLDEFFPNRLKKYTRDYILKFLKDNTTITRRQLWLKYKAIYNACIQRFPELLPDRINKIRSLKSVIKEAKKYKYRSEFQVKSRANYLWAFKRGYLDLICKHMALKTKNLYTRYIYVYEFKDKYAYIGLTWNLKNRHKDHLHNGPVHTHIKKCNKYKLKILEKHVLYTKATRLEERWINKYRKIGWNVLNSKYSKPCLGGNTYKYSKKYLIKSAKKYKIKKNFIKKQRKLYHAILKRGLLKEACSHMING